MSYVKQISSFWFIRAKNESGRGTTYRKDPYCANSIIKYTGPPGKVDAPSSRIMLGWETSFSSWYSESRSANSVSRASSFRVLTATVVKPTKQQNQQPNKSKNRRIFILTLFFLIKQRRASEIQESYRFSLGYNANFLEYLFV